MENEQLIPIEQFCEYYQVEFSFIHSLSEFGLVEIASIEEKEYLHHEQIKDIEKLIRMHYDLEINLEGIDVISHLLQKVESMRIELNGLKNKLRFYES